MNKTSQKGFTLYELMITLTIVGMVMAIGVPNMIAYSQNSRMTATANDLHAAFHFARSEASRAKTFITICASANSMTATPTCNGNLQDGYIVFLDLDGDVAVGVGETILRAEPALPDGVKMNVANNAKYFSFAGTGLGRGQVGATPSITQIVMCDDRGNIKAAGGSSAARLFVATPLGRATIQRDLSMIQAVMDTHTFTCS
jgi:prepilin-type N-terminal cleavage/methylation domain-containing protein